MKAFLQMNYIKSSLVVDTTHYYALFFRCGFGYQDSQIETRRMYVKGMVRNI